MKQARLKFKISKGIKESVQLKKGEYLLVKSLIGDTLILTKPKVPVIKERALLDVISLGSSGIRDISSNHDFYLYPAKKTISK